MNEHRNQPPGPPPDSEILAAFRGGAPEGASDVNPGPNPKPRDVAALIARNPDAVVRILVLAAQNDQFAIWQLQKEGPPRPDWFADPPPTHEEKEAYWNRPGAMVGGMERVGLLKRVGSHYHELAPSALGWELLRALAGERSLSARLAEAHGPQ